MSCKTPHAVVKSEKWNRKQVKEQRRSRGTNAQTLKGPLFSSFPFVAFKYYLQISDLSISEKHI